MLNYMFVLLCSAATVWLRILQFFYPVSYKLSLRRDLKNENDIPHCCFKDGGRSATVKECRQPPEAEIDTC